MVTFQFSISFFESVGKLADATAKKELLIY